LLQQVQQVQQQEQQEQPQAGAPALVKPLYQSPSSHSMDAPLWQDAAGLPPTPDSLPPVPALALDAWSAAHAHPPNLALIAHQGLVSMAGSCTPLSSAHLLQHGGSSSGGSSSGSSSGGSSSSSSSHSAVGGRERQAALEQRACAPTIAPLTQLLGLCLNLGLPLQDSAAKALRQAAVLAGASRQWDGWWRWGIEALWQGAGQAGGQTGTVRPAARKCAHLCSHVVRKVAGQGCCGCLGTRARRYRGLVGTLKALRLPL